MRKFKKLINYILVLALVIGFLPITHNVKAESKDLPKTTLRPKETKVNLSRLEDWNIKDTLNEKINVSSVKRVERSQGELVNDLASEDGKIQVLSLMNARGDKVSSVGSNEFKSYAFDFWQYTNSMIFWDGVIPTPDVIDAAHRNGVPIYGTLFFNWSSSASDNEIFAKFIEEDSPGSKTFPSARKLAEIAKYYGFDGYFFNQETTGYGTAGKGEQMRDFMIYAKKYAKEELNYPILFSWYDAMANSGNRYHHNAVNSYNDLYVKPVGDEVPADDFFMNFNWSKSNNINTNNHMQSISRSPFDAYAGFELQANSYKTRIDRSGLVGDDNKLITSIGLFTPDSIQGLSADGEDYHEQERKFWVGFDGDPVTSDDSNSWSGMARFVGDKTPVTSLPFKTYFNTGHGRKYFVDGQVSKDEEWTARSVQEVLPTWRWWIRSNTDSVLKARYDFDDAFNSGNSLVFEGDLNSASTNDIMLYSTDVDFTSNTKLRLTYKGGENSKVRLGFTSDSSYSKDSFSYVDLDTSKSGDWFTQEFDLSSLSGQNIKAIKLQIENSSNISGYKFNLGELSIYNDGSKVNAPDNLKVEESLVHTGKKAEAIVSYDRVDNADYYQIFVKSEGKWNLITATSSNYAYLDKIVRSENDENTTQEIKVVAVGKNGTLSDEQIVEFDWGLTVKDTGDLPIDSENVVLGAEVTDVSSENAGEQGRNALNGTITGNSDKWTSMGYEGYLDIKLTQPRTVRRWVVDHAGAGGESVNDGLMNTKNFDLQYKVNPEDEWTTLKSIDNNIAHVTDVNIEEPVTAQYWRLNIRAGHNGSPWGAIRIYNWKMYEEESTNETPTIPMQYVQVENIKDNTYSVNILSVPTDTTIKLYKDINKTELLKEIKQEEGQGDLLIEDLTLEGESGLIYYTSTLDGKDESTVLASKYEKEEIKSIKLISQPEKIEYILGEELDQKGAVVEITYEDEEVKEINLPNTYVKLEDFDKNTSGDKNISLEYKGNKVEGTIDVKYAEKSVVESISIGEELQSKYLLNEKLNLDKGTILVKYENGEEKEIPLNDKDVKIDWQGSDKLGKFEISIEYEGKTTTFEYQVEKEEINYQRLEQKLNDVEGVFDNYKYKNASKDKKSELDKLVEEAILLLNNASEQSDVDDMVTRLDKAINDLDGKEVNETVEKIKELENLKDEHKDKFIELLENHEDEKVLEWANKANDNMAYYKTMTPPEKKEMKPLEGPLMGGYFRTWHDNNANFDEERPNYFGEIPEEVDLAFVFTNYTPEYSDFWRELTENYVPKLNAQGTRVLQTFTGRNLVNDIDGVSFPNTKEGNRERAEYLVNEMMTKYGLDGIDIDIEFHDLEHFSTPEKIQQAKDVLEELSKLVGPKSNTGKLFIVDSNMNGNEEILQAFFPYVDYVMLQVYGQGGENRLDSKWQNYKQYIKPEQFLVGFSFYEERDWNRWNDITNKVEGSRAERYALWQPEEGEKAGIFSYAIDRDGVEFLDDNIYHTDYEMTKQLKHLMLENKDQDNEEVDKSRLEELVNQANEINIDELTENSANILNDALNNAKEVLEDTETTQEKVNKAIEDLNNVLKNIESKKNFNVIIREVDENKEVVKVLEEVRFSGSELENYDSLRNQLLKYVSNKEYILVSAETDKENSIYIYDFERIENIEDETDEELPEKETWKLVINEVNDDNELVKELFNQEFTGDSQEVFKEIGVKVTEYLESEIYDLKDARVDEESRTLTYDFVNINDLILVIEDSNKSVSEISSDFDDKLISDLGENYRAILKDIVFEYRITKEKKDSFDTSQKVELDISSLGLTDNDELHVYRIFDDQIEKIEYTSIENNIVTFESDKFQTFVFATSVEEIEETESEEETEEETEKETEEETETEEEKNVKNGIYEEESKLFFYEDDIKTFKGLFELDGSYYYAKRDGEIVTSRKYYVTKDNGLLPKDHYTFDEKGRIVEEESNEDLKNGIYEEEGKLFFYENGEKTFKGLFELDGSYYFAKRDGELVTSRKYYVTKNNGLLPKDHYTFDEKGRIEEKESNEDLKNGIYEEEGKLFFYENGEKTFKGLFLDNGKYYFAKRDGELVRSRKYYVTKTNGLLPTNHYTFDENGVMLVEE